MQTRLRTVNIVDTGGAPLLHFSNAVTVTPDRMDRMLNHTDVAFLLSRPSCRDYHVRNIEGMRPKASTFQNVQKGHEHCTAAPPHSGQGRESKKIWFSSPSSTLAPPQPQTHPYSYLTFGFRVCASTGFLPQVQVPYRVSPTTTQQHHRSASGRLAAPQLGKIRGVPPSPRYRARCWSARRSRRSRYRHAQLRRGAPSPRSCQSGESRQH